MGKDEILELINKDFEEKKKEWESMGSEEREQWKGNEGEFWNGHNCKRYEYNGYCLDCGSNLKNE